MTAVVPHYAMSGGTMISLGADRIVMDDHAALGPIDPQLGQYPAASILLLLRMFVEELVRGGDWQVTDRIVEVTVSIACSFVVRPPTRRLLSL